MTWGFFCYLLLMSVCPVFFIFFTITKESLDAQMRGYLERLRQNKELSKNLYWRLPVNDGGHENFVPVGRGVKSSKVCARFLSDYICRRTDLHKDVVIKGSNFSGKMVVKRAHLWCNKASCCVCFAHGWAPREARSIEGRVNEGVRRGFGKPEHIFVSVPPRDYGLSEDVLRERCRLALLDRGCIGGCMIFHGFRPDRVNKILVWSPHYHSVGFIHTAMGGFDGCRNCHKRGLGKCDDCDGFKGREVRGYARDGYFVRCMEDERKSVFLTGWYQLNHSTLRVGIKRFHVVTWFGLLGCSKLRASKVKAQILCPACHYGMEKAVHVGEKRVSRDFSEADYASLFADDEFDDSGDPNYICGGGGRVE